VTIHQFNTLKWIYNEGGISENAVRKCHQGNIGSLAKKKWIEHAGRYVLVTALGIEMMEKYRHRLTRKHASDPTDRVKRLLHLSRVIQMRKVA
jgi:hypothetical protein